MKRKLLITGGVLGGLLIIFFVVKGNKGTESSEILISVNFGKFKVEIETTGELEAKNSTKILGPSGLRNYRIYSVSIQDIIDEGTVVRKGDWIANLDQSELNNKLKDAQSDLEQKESQYIQTQLDTTLQMRQARDELINLDYAIEEAEITLEQSQFEPPATIKQAEINVGKAKRALVQAKENYKIKVAQNVAKMQEVASALSKVRREYNEMLNLQQSFTIIAPEDGMLIYRKGYDGKPIKEGSQISAFDPVVATLPDLSIMISKTYINEVDIRKVKIGQFVEIGLDAFPEKRLTGRIINVANVGEQRPNSDAKVFQVNVQVFGTDDTIRPAMTTSNSILANEMDSVMFISLECLHNQDDSITYVFKKTGLKITKQEVMVGVTNSDEAVIMAGLKQSDRLYLSFPIGFEDSPVALIPEMDGKRFHPEPEEQEINIEERMITLPNGMQVPVSRMEQFRQGRNNQGGQSPGGRQNFQRRSNGQGQRGGQRKQEQPKIDSLEKSRQSRESTESQN